MALVSFLDNADILSNREDAENEMHQILNKYDALCMTTRECIK